MWLPGVQSPCPLALSQLARLGSCWSQASAWGQESLALLTQD